jgi:peptide/nickel transport system permease protein
MALKRGSVGNVIAAITIAEIPRVSRLVRRGPVLARTALHRSGRGRRHAHVDDRPQACIAEDARAADGAGNIYLRQCHDHRGDLVLSGCRHAADYAIVGNIMAEGRVLWQVKFYIVLFPAIFLSLTVLAVNLLGDGLRDALDPRMAKKL